MAWLDFVWTDTAVDKIAQHGLSVSDVETVIQNPIDVSESRSSDRLVARGYTDDGRWIVCVYEAVDRITIMPVTAYEPSKGSR
jgi:uncharacterized DUF497 family protein